MLISTALVILAAIILTLLTTKFLIFLVFISSLISSLYFFKIKKSYFILSLIFITTCFYVYYKKEYSLTILKEPINFKIIYAEVDDIQSSPYKKQSYIYLTNVMYNNNIISKVRVTYKKNHNLQKGDIIEAIANLTPPSENFYPHGVNFRNAAKQKGLAAYGYLVGNIKIIENWHEKPSFNIMTYVENIKNYLNNKLTKYSTERVAPFFSAIMLGEYAFLPKEDMNNLQKLSISHYISISGYHITIIAAIVFFVIRHLLIFLPRFPFKTDGKTASAIITIFILIFYGLMVKDYLPALRAIIMTCTFLLAVIIKRPVISLNNLLLSCLVILLINPYNIYSASFLLSFTATLTLINLYNSKIVYFLNSHSHKNLLYRACFFFLLVCFTTLSIEITLSPILLFYFGTIPLLSIIANLIAAPLFSFIIMPALLIVLFTPEFIGIYFVKAATITFTFLLNVAQYLASFKYANLWFNFFPDYLVLIFLISYLLFSCINNRIKYTFLIPMLGVFIYFFGFHKTPTITILPSDAAFFKIDNTYIVSDVKKAAFAKNIWFKDPATKVDSMNNNINFSCNSSFCSTTINNHVVKYIIKEDLSYHDCDADIVVTNLPINNFCNYKYFIDQNFLEKHGTTAIYITYKGIKIISTH